MVAAVMLPNPKVAFITSAGAPAVGYKVYTYDAGTLAPRATYLDAAGGASNTNPIILDARGEAVIYWDGAYKVILKDAADVTIWTVDNFTNAFAPLTLNATSGLVGINMTPVNVLDITKTQNANSRIALTNASAGIAATAQLFTTNGTHTGYVSMQGVTFTTAGAFRQDGMTVICDGAGGLSLATGAVQPIYILINSVEAARFDTSSRFLINATAPAAPSSNETFSVKDLASGSTGGTVGYFYSTSATYNQSVLQVASAAAAGTGWNLIVGRCAAGVAVFVVAGNGNVTNTNNSYGAISMRSLKQDIAPARSQWGDVKALATAGVNYRLKADVDADGNGPTLLGAIAEDWEQISPGLISVDPDGVKTIAYSVAYMKGLIALGEAMRRIESLEARLAAAGIP